MQDLLQPDGSKQRSMVVSSSVEEMPMGSTCVSRSCPDMLDYQHRDSLSHGSLPNHLEPCQILGGMTRTNPPNKSESKSFCPCTPPPSPSLKARPQKNLVLISTLLVDPLAPNFKTFYNSVSLQFSVLDVFLRKFFVFRFEDLLLLILIV